MMFAHNDYHGALSAYSLQTKEAYRSRVGQGAGEQVRSFEVGSSLVNVSFATQELCHVVSPFFAPSSIRNVDHERLNVLLFDSSSAQWPAPIPDFLATKMRAKALAASNKSAEPVWFFSDDRFSVTWNEWTPISELTILDRLHNEATVCLRGCGRHIANGDLHSPLRSLFSSWFEDQQSLLVHGAAVGRPEGGVLIVGSNGSGKSTCALSCLGTELKFAGDDSVLVSLSPLKRVHMLYSSASFWRKDIDRFPQGAHLLGRAGPKAVVSLAHRPEWLIPSFPLRGIFTTAFSSSERSSVTPISPGVALRALAPSSLTRNPAQLVRSFKQMATLVSSVPCFCLKIGSNFQGISEVLGSFIQQGSSCDIGVGDL